MTETIYTGQVDSHPDSLRLATTLPSASSPPGRPQVVTYEDYSRTSPFSYNSSCDQSLLTPISSVGSPSMPQQSGLPRYSPHGGGPQQPTPPTTTKLGWDPTFAEGVSSTQPGHVDQYDHLAAHPTSFYAGYPVTTESIKQEHPEKRMSPFYPSMAGGVHGPMVSGQPQQYSMVPAHMASLPTEHMMESVPPNSFMHRPLPEDLEPYHHQTPQPAPQTHRQSGRISKSKPPKRRPRQNNALSFNMPQDGAPSYDEIVSQLNLSKDTPAENRFIIENWVRTHAENGTNQWAEIQARHEKYYPKKAIQALQMNMSRTKSKFLTWDKADEDILQRIAKEDEEQRYRRIADQFNSTRAKGQIRFNQNNIEMKLVELGIDNYNVDPETNLRPRKKLSTGRKKGKGSVSSTTEPAEEAVLEPPDLDEHRRDGLYDSILRRSEALGYDAMDEDGDCDDENAAMYGAGLHGVHGGHPGGAHHSERVARQACEEMMKSQILDEP